MWLIALSLFGLVVPNGFFIYWLFFEFTSLAAIIHNTLAVAFMMDAFIAVGLLAYLFARYPVGPIRWTWFVILSFVGGLGFSIPFYLWLNGRLFRR